MFVYSDEMKSDYLKVSQNQISNKEICRDCEHWIECSHNYHDDESNTAIKFGCCDVHSNLEWDMFSFEIDHCGLFLSKY